MSKFFNNSDLEFDPEVFNDEPLFDPEPQETHTARYCDELIIEPLEMSDDDSSSEFDVAEAEVEKSDDDESVEVDDDDSLTDLGYNKNATKKTTPARLAERKRLIKAFGRKPRKGYHLITTPEKIIFEKRFGNGEAAPLTPLKSFLGNGVEVEVRDSLIPGAGKGL